MMALPKLAFEPSDDIVDVDTTGVPSVPSG